MTNVNAKVNGQPAHMPKPASAPGSPAQSPSVPISLYREVATELQTTQTTLQSLKTQNQELTQKNQQLRLEIERVVQSALHLRQIADPTWGSVSTGLISDVASGTELTHRDRPEASLVSAPPIAEPLFTEQPVPTAPPNATEPSAEISTWWLILIICLIVITAFGTGFLIVRPLLPSR
ncbi:MAG: hypothetical protein NW220_05455 [Leptolyngbyaceae cyanobacterium bins.349]|nr:hypothetical protein [Leptolyngbyaceae cyanobacterium bins.349]